MSFGIRGKMYSWSEYSEKDIYSPRKNNAGKEEKRNRHESENENKQYEIDPHKKENQRGKELHSTWEEK